MLHGGPGADHSIFRPLFSKGGFNSEVHNNLSGQDLLNNLFRHPYTKIEFVVKDLEVTRLTATKYLDQLVERGFLEKQKIGRSNYYIGHGRKADRSAPPAQIRTCATNAYGSYFRCLARNRISG